MAGTAYATRHRMTICRLLSLGLLIPALVLSGCSAQAEGEEDTAELSSEAITGSVTAGARLVATRAVNLRSGPSTSSSVLALIPPGGAVTAVGGSAQSGFYKVTFEGRTGWSYGAYLDR